MYVIAQSPNIMWRPGADGPGLLMADRSEFSTIHVPHAGLTSADDETLLSSVCLTNTEIQARVTLCSVLTSAGSQLQPGSSSVWWSAGSGWLACSAVCSVRSGQTGYNPEIERKRKGSAEHTLIRKHSHWRWLLLPFVQREPQPGNSHWTTTSTVSSILP